MIVVSVVIEYGQKIASRILQIEHLTNEKHKTQIISNLFNCQEKTNVSKTAE